jgi:group I intron endonuclease
MTAALGYIYAIENTMNEHRYIGSTTDYKRRWHTHRSSLRKGKHHSFILQRAWDKYGESAFVFKLLLICSRDQRTEYENRLMPLQTYNVYRTAKEQLVRGGWRHKPEFCEKISLLHKGKHLSAEHREKLSALAKARVYDASFKEKARQRQLGVSPSQETRIKLADAVRVARQTEVNSNKQRVSDANAAVVAGARIKDACEKLGITRSTYYKYVVELGLPLAGHKNRELVV